MQLQGGYHVRHHQKSKNFGADYHGLEPFSKAQEMPRKRAHNASYIRDIYEKIERIQAAQQRCP
jgi:hypothetical protein